MAKPTPSDSNVELKWSSLTETQRWAQKFSSQLKLQRPCVVLLSGPLGAGKTQLVKWFLQGMGYDDAVSPTFAIHQKYETPSGPVDHVDLYRLKNDEQLESSGFWDLFENRRGLVFVEWADRLPTDVWPNAWKKIFIHLSLGIDSEARVARVINSP